MKNNRTFACSVVVLFIMSTGLSALATAQDQTAQNTHDPEARLKELGIVLPPAPQPVANYVNGVRIGNLIFLAGKGPKRADGSELTGKLGADVSIDEGYEGARLTAINQLAVLKEMLGDLKKVKRNDQSKHQYHRLCFLLVCTL